MRQAPLEDMSSWSMTMDYSKMVEGWHSVKHIHSHHTEHLQLLLYQMFGQPVRCGHALGALHVPGQQLYSQSCPFLVGMAAAPLCLPIQPCTQIKFFKISSALHYCTVKNQITVTLLDAVVLAGNTILHWLHNYSCQFCLADRRGCLEVFYTSRFRP